MESLSESDIRQGCVANGSKSDDVSFKLVAVQMAERTSKSAAARRYNEIIASLNLLPTSINRLGCNSKCVIKRLGGKTRKYGRWDGYAN